MQLDIGPALHPVTPGATGEIHIVGLAVTGSYLGRPRSAPIRAGSGPAATAPVTSAGARGRHIEFLGRRDDQVKIRGYRVEPGETERAVGDLPGGRVAVR